MSADQDRRCGEIRPDVAHSFAAGRGCRRSCARPALAASGINVARTRMVGLIEGYGAETVKGVMRKIINDGERGSSRSFGRSPTEPGASACTRNARSSGIAASIPYSSTSPRG